MENARDKQDAGDGGLERGSGRGEGWEDGELDITSVEHSTKTS